MADNGNDVKVEEERRPTERVILEQRTVLLLPADVDPAKVEEAIKLLGLRKRGRAAVELAWVEVSRQTGMSKTVAIEAFAGKPGTADAKVGVWRAPSLAAWKGAVVYEAPPVPLVQRSLLD